MVFSAYSEIFCFQFFLEISKMNNNIFIVFACNAKSFAIAIILFLLHNKSGQTNESCFLNFPNLLGQMSVAQFGHTGKTPCHKYLLQSEISFVKALHAMCFRENNKGTNKWVYKNEHV